MKIDNYSSKQVWQDTSDNVTEKQKSKHEYEILCGIIKPDVWN